MANFHLLKSEQADMHTRMYQSEQKSVDKRRACKFRVLKLARSVQKKQPITIEYFTAMLIMQYLFIVNVPANFLNAYCCFSIEMKHLRLYTSFTTMPKVFLP